MKKTMLLLLICFFLATGKSTECDVIATVFDESICFADIEYQPKAFKPDTKTKNEQEINKLAFLIREIGIRNLLKKEAYTPKKKEVAAYFIWIEKAQEEKLKNNVKFIETIRYLLKTYNYEKKNKIRLEKDLKTFEYSLKEKERERKWQKEFYDDIAKRFGKDSAKKMREKSEERKRNKETTKYLSKKIVKQWKTNKALHDKYGGRVIFQQFGIEPIDAYQKLIEDIRDKGKLIILKTEYRDIFSDQEDYNKSNKHNFIPLDSFSKPHWEEVISNESYLETIEHYKSIPHK